MNDELSGYNDWQSAFADYKDISISELHGLMTAIMTACAPPETDGWVSLLDELSLSVPSDDALALLRDYAEDVSFMLKDNDDAYGYEPLVPDDEHELSERLWGLKDWAGGFLTGVGIAELSLSVDEREQLRDLAQIAAIRPDDETGEFDADEETYFALFEFARLVPVLLFRKNRKAVKDLAVIKGLAQDRRTAKELADEAHTQSGATLGATLGTELGTTLDSAPSSELELSKVKLPPVIDASKPKG